MPRKPKLSPKQANLVIPARSTRKAHQKTPNVISIERIPDPPKGPRRRHYKTLAGHTTGLGPWEYLATVFAANEQVHRTHKLTDEAIRLAVVNEFRGLRRKGQQGIADRCRKSPWEIARLRGYYNKGRLTGGTIPKVLSHRYDSNGQQIT